MKPLLLFGHVTATDLPQLTLYLLCSFLVGLCVALTIRAGDRSESNTNRDE